MLPLDDLVEVAASLARDDLLTLTIVDRRHHSLVESHFHGTGPLKFVYWACVNDEGMMFSCRDAKLSDVDELPSLTQFCYALRNCFVSTLSFHAGTFDDEDLVRLRDVKDAYVIGQAELSGGDGGKKMQLLDAIPRCNSLQWNHSLTEDFFSSGGISNVRYLTLRNFHRYDDDALIAWLHSPVGSGLDRRLSLIQHSYDLDVTTLTRRLKQKFLHETASHEYQLYVFGEKVTLNNTESGTWVNEIADALDVDTRASHHADICITRLSRTSANRTTLVACASGPNVWDLCTVEDHTNHLSGNSVTELLARSGLIANEVLCKCGRPMNLRLDRPLQLDHNRPRNTSIYNSVWKCSGECLGPRRRRFKVPLNVGSWLKTMSWLGDCDLLLKSVILLCNGKTDGEVYYALGGHVQYKHIERLRAEYVRIANIRPPEEDNVKCKLRKFYENVKLAYDFEEPYKIPPDFVPWQ